jgi:hypothetical protein
MVVCMGRVGIDDVDVPSWKGRRGRLSTAKEGRKKTLDAIFGVVVVYCKDS